MACTEQQPYCAAGACTETAPSASPSCEDLDANCGPSKEDSCCARGDLVTGGTFKRDNDAAYAATISDFRLDKFEVTVGRFRKFVDAVVDAQYRPAVGTGKHTHLHATQGLANSGNPGAYEQGWEAAWEAHLHATPDSWSDTASLACEPNISTWTAAPGDNETRPINCVSWF